MASATRASLTLTHATLSDNSASAGGGGGIWNALGATKTLVATIVANSGAGLDCDGEGTLADNGYNLDDDGSCGFTSSTDLSDTSAGLDPSGLVNNGGPTLTIALESGSLAIHHVTPGSDCSGNDQRGVPWSTPCNIGAIGTPLPSTTTTTSLSGGGQSGSSISVPAGTAVTDTAALTGTNASTATGMVTYSVYSDSGCTTAVSTGTAETISTPGTLPASGPVTLSTPGTYYWQATYSGDSANDSSASTCGATGEVETVTPAQSYTVTFDPNGGSGTMAPETESAPTALTANAFTRAGYTFTSWNTAADGSGTSYADGATYAFTASTTLYAHWTANATDTITFDSEGGSAVASVMGLNGTTITLPAAPTYAGHSFDGWFTAASGGSALTSPYTLSASTTLHAHWTADATDTVTFNSEGGSAVASVMGLNGTTITLPAAPTYAGRSFNGWFVAASGGTALTSPYTLTASTTLYAQWSADADTITFNSEGGSAVASQSGLNGTTITLPAAPTYAAHSFNGWFAAASGGTALTSPYTLTASTTLYAQWSANTPPPPAPPVTSPSSVSHGYWLDGSDGGIFGFGAAQFYGSTGSLILQRPVVGIVPTKDHGGYWLDASDGGVFSFGDTQFYGSIPGLGLHPAGSHLPNSLDAPIVAMVPSIDDNGYFMVASDGGVFAFGDAHFAGSCPGIGGCSGAAVAVMPDASGNGYWLVTQTGNVYTFGDAAAYGAPGNTGSPVTSAVSTPNGGGYWILTANGTVYNYGNAANLGDAAGAFGGFDPATAVFTTSDGGGYWIASANGTVDKYGDAPNDGDMSGTHLNGSIIAATGF